MWRTSVQIQMHVMKELMYFGIFLMLKVMEIDMLKPSYLWPLNRLTNGFDVVNEMDLVNAKPSQEFSFSLNGNARLFEQSSLIFKGNSFLDVVVNSSLPITSPIFSVYIRTNILKSNPVFHYKALVPRTDEIEQIYLEMNEAIVVSVVYGGYSSNISTSCTAGADPNSNGYVDSLISFFHDFKTGGMRIVRDNHKHAIRQGRAGKKLGLPGILHIGGFQDKYGIMDEYYGEMSCMSILDTPAVNNNRISPDVIKSICNTNPNPTYIWPFNDKALLREVKTNNPPLSYDNPYINFQYDPWMNESALRFDGSQLSTVELELSTNFLSKDFYIMTYIYLDINNDGIILVIKDSINGLLLNVNDNFMSLVLINSNGNICVELNNVVVSPQTWIPFLIAKIGDVVQLDVDGRCYTNSFTCQFNIDSTSLIIGTDNEIDEGFKGALRCLLIYEIPLSNMNYKTTLDNVCLLETEYNFGQLETNSGPLEKRSTRQIISKRDAAPPNTTVPLEVKEHRSLSACGKSCLMTSYCFSFTYSKRGICVLYATYLVRSLEQRPGTNYYKVDQID